MISKWNQRFDEPARMLAPEKEGDVTPEYYKRVAFGSSEPEYYLYDADGHYLRFWSVYNDGQLPSYVQPLPVAVEI